MCRCAHFCTTETLWWCHFRLLPPRQLANETALTDGLETDENVLAIVEVAGSMGECWVSKGLVINAEKYVFYGLLIHIS